MGSVIVVILVALAAYSWLRATQKNRQQWLRRLDLPGTWHREGSSGVLELSGGLSHGQYRIEDPERAESGEWRLEGHTLQLIPTGRGQPLDYDLRLFNDEKIGIDGPGREHRIYVRVPSNVVNLHRHAGR